MRSLNPPATKTRRRRAAAQGIDRPLQQALGDKLFSAPMPRFEFPAAGDQAAFDLPRVRRPLALPCFPGSPFPNTRFIQRGFRIKRRAPRRFLLIRRGQEPGRAARGRGRRAVFPGGLLTDLISRCSTAMMQCSASSRKLQSESRRGQTRRRRIPPVLPAL